MPPAGQAAPFGRIAVAIMSSGALDLPATLVVLAHPDHRSFNAAWALSTADASKVAGHDVLWSDLYAMGFDAIEGPGHYGDWPKDAQFDPLKAQETATAQKTIPADVMTEIEKIRQADRIIFHFPIWWFSAPAILKGWFERVFVHGEMHSVADRFDKGFFAGKKALICVTTGAKATECTIMSRWSQ